MTIELTPEQVRLLKELITQRIEELGPEIHHTRSPSYHDQLKDERELLKKLHETLAAHSPTP